MISTRELTGISLPAARVMCEVLLLQVDWDDTSLVVHALELADEASQTERGLVTLQVLVLLSELDSGSRG